MTAEKKSNTLSRFPKCKPGKPRILADKKKAMYPCFCIQNIYFDLFVDTKTEEWPYARKPLISLPRNLYSKKDLLSFILPEEIFSQIETAHQNGRLLVRDNDYKEFFLISTNNNKIAKLLFDIFSSDRRDSEKIFIEKIQSHFIQMLRPADYLQPQLVNYLRSFCDDSIVPASVSADANKAFHCLVDSMEHDAISKGIANIFISAMLGLYSMKYKSNETERGFQFARTYLLNKLGMDFIWIPESISGSYIKLQDAQSAYTNCEYNDAYVRILKWLDESAAYAKETELAAAYHILGACLYLHPELCITDGAPVHNKEALDTSRSEGVVYLEKSSSINPAEPEVHFFLFEHYKIDDKERALDHLKTAFAQNYAKAVIEVAIEFLRAQKEYNDTPKNQLISKLTGIIEKEKNYADVDVSECLYLCGLFAKRDGRESESESYFELAAQKGHEKARQELSRRGRIERQQFPAFSDDQKAPCCFANTLTGNNLAFASTLPTGEWSLFTIGELNPNRINANKVRDIDEFIQSRRFADFEFQHAQTVFLFMSEDEDRNLNECLMLLDKLFNIALGISENQRCRLIDSIDIFVGAKYEMASMLIDANINDMGNDIYFKVHIADETRDAVHQLLCDAPLFIPYLNKTRHDDSSNIVLFGCTETNYRFIKESIACAYLGDSYPVSITMLGAGADCLERRLRQECPGIYHDPHVECIRPMFLHCCIEEADFPSYIYGSDHDNHPDDAIVKVLSCGNYFVIDLSNDCNSIRFAMELRTWLLRSRGTFDRTPFIAVKCMSSQNSYLAAHLTLSGQAAGNTYYSRYDLFPFGISREMYSFHRLIEKPRLEEVALQIHKSYYGGKDRQAENDYYSFSYNADSSLLTAIGLSYRLFAGGSFFPQKEQYLNFGAYDSIALLSDYVEAIKSKEEFAAALEQSRWNGFMLSRGWESADASRVRAYKDQSTGSSHKHTLAKLHPFIREWTDLDSDDLIKILGMLQSKFDYNKLPKSTTRKSIKDTPKFLSRPSRGDEKTH